MNQNAIIPIPSKTIKLKWRNEEMDFPTKTSILAQALLIIKDMIRRPCPLLVMEDGWIPATGRGRVGSSKKRCDWRPFRVLIPLRL